MTDTVSSTNFVLQREGTLFGVSYPKDLPYETALPFVAASDLQTLLGSIPAPGVAAYGTYITLKRDPTFPLLYVKLTGGVGWAFNFPLAYASELAGLLGQLVSVWGTLIPTDTSFDGKLATFESSLVQHGVGAPTSSTPGILYIQDS